MQFRQPLMFRSDVDDGDLDATSNDGAHYEVHAGSLPGNDSAAEASAGNTDANSAPGTGMGRGRCRVSVAFFC